MKYSPSLMSMDLLKLEEGIRFFDSNAHMLHVDIMDGHFVKNITMSPLFIKQIRALTTLPIEAHLMMTDPEVLIESCVDAGADYITIHVEATNGSAIRIIDMIQQKYGKKAGIAVNPETPLADFEILLEYVDLINFMAIDPGFPGTRFVSKVLDKVSATNRIRAENNYSYEIQIDGSIGPDNYRDVAASGPDYIIAGEPTLYNLDPALSQAWEKMLVYMTP